MWLFNKTNKESSFIHFLEEEKENKLCKKADKTKLYWIWNESQEQRHEEKKYYTTDTIESELSKIPRTKYFTKKKKDSENVKQIKDATQQYCFRNNLKFNIFMIVFHVYWMWV